MFEERFIAFVDILGFKNIVKKASQDEQYQKKVSAILYHIAKIKTDNYDNEHAQYGKYSDVAVYSDSIVISYPCELNDDSTLVYLLVDLVYLSLTLARNDIFIRGGVTVGKVIHDKNISWGPAFVSAYEIEEENAIYPRIIIDKSVIDRNKEIEEKIGGFNEDDDVSDLIEQDADGLFYLDYLAQWEEFDAEDDYFDCLKDISSNVIRNINNAPNAKIKMKYIWYANYYNRAVKKLKPCYRTGLLIDMTQFK